MLGLGYEVHGLVRRVALEDSNRRFDRIAHLLDKIQLHPASLESYPSIFHIVSRHDFDECYHLAAQSFVAESFADGFSTMNTNINGTHYMLAALRELRPKCRFYFAGSSEMFGKVRETPQRETTPFHPRSPYGISKVAGFDLTRNYREAYGMFCASGHPLQSRRAASRFRVRDAQDHLDRGADQDRHWRPNCGSATSTPTATGDTPPTTCARCSSCFSRTTPDDYVVATGETHTVREFCERAFADAGLDYRSTSRLDDRFYRPAEVDLLIGDASRARETLGWEPKYSFAQLVSEMVNADLESVARRQDLSASVKA